jgi:hypothetical protein
MRTTWAADHYEAEAKEVRRALGDPGRRRGRRAALRGAAAALFDAIRETPRRS